MGRWQTRIIVFLFVGLPATLLFALAWIGDRSDSGFSTVFLILSTVFLVGMALDIVYFTIQSLRWENDWPFVLHLFFSICEFLIVLVLMAFDLLPFAPASVISGAAMRVTLIMHFILVLSLSVLVLLGPLQVFLPRWRYNGGEIGKF